MRTAFDVTILRRRRELCGPYSQSDCPLMRTATLEVSVLTPVTSLTW